MTKAKQTDQTAINKDVAETITDTRVEVSSLRDAVLAKLVSAVGKDPIVASDRDWFAAA